MFLAQLLVETHQLNVCMLLFRSKHTRQDEVTYTLTQWCSCGGVSVNEFMEDCLILLYHLSLYLLFINVSM